MPDLLHWPCRQQLTSALLYQFAASESVSKSIIVVEPLSAVLECSAGSMAAHS